MRVTCPVYLILLDFIIIIIVNNKYACEINEHYKPMGDAKQQGEHQGIMRSKSEYAKQLRVLIQVHTI
jgi:hypothetical protein